MEWHSKVQKVQKSSNKISIIFFIKKIKHGFILANHSSQLEQQQMTLGPIHAPSSQIKCWGIWYQNMATHKTIGSLSFSLPHVFFCDLPASLSLSLRYITDPFASLSPSLLGDYFCDPSTVYHHTKVANVPTTHTRYPSHDYAQTCNVYAYFVVRMPTLYIRTLKVGLGHRHTACPMSS